MKSIKNCFLFASIAILAIGCKPDPIGPEVEYQKEGIYISSVSNTSAGISYYGNYFTTTPTENTDLTAGSAFSSFHIRAQYNEFLYGYATDGSTTLVKYGIDKTTNALAKIAELPLFEAPSGVIILSEELGVLTMFNNTEIKTFNPSTMVSIGTIDMSGAKTFPNNTTNGYSGLIHNTQTGKLYAPLYTDNNATSVYYDSDSVFVEVIDAVTLTRDKTIEHPKAQYAVFRGHTNPVIDESGNTYIIAQGSYGLDGAVGPYATQKSLPQILKIDTNSEFDTTYAFNPIPAVGFGSNYFQLFTTMVYGANNKAYGIGTGATESAQMLELLQKWGAGTITQEEMDLLINLVLFGENMKVIEIDLTNKTAQFVQNMPLTAGFGYPVMTNINGKVITAMASNNGAFNGFYEVDPTTNTGTELLKLSAGGFAHQYINLAAGAQ